MRPSFPTLDRSFYIAHGSRKVRSRTTTAVAYLHEGVGASGKTRFYAACFVGKQSKPLTNYFYMSEASREKAVRGFFADAQVRETYREQRKQESKAATIKAAACRTLGDIYVETNSYDMTHNTFYQVVALVGKTSVRVRAIGAITTVDHGNYQGEEIPSIDGFKPGSRELVKRIVEGRLAIGHRGARRWDGTPVSFNHMD